MLTDAAITAVAVLAGAVVGALGGVIGALLTARATRLSQKELFDHRLRLESEYGLYSDLWDKVFELRRT